MLESWDRVAIPAGLLHNLTALVNNSLQRKKIRPLPVLDWNPYRERVKAGLKITHDNFEMLGRIGGGRK